MKGNVTIGAKPSHKQPFALASSEVRIAPSVLAADFARLEEEVARVEAAGATVLHLDVMDGHFVPNISFGVPVIASLRKRTKMFLDAHLMITDPLKYAKPFVKAGSDHVTFHIETVHEPSAVIDQIRGLGASVGLCLNPDTLPSAIDPVIDRVDLVLVMSVWPGFGGQKFLDKVLPKCRQLRERLRPDQRLQIDGGLAPATIARAVQAGCDTIVAGSAIFGQADPAAAFVELQRLGQQAAA